jgi:hypothetical protein
MRDRLWIPFELPSSGLERQSRLRELPLFEGPGDSSGTAILSIFVPRFLLDNIQAKPEISDPHTAAGWPLSQEFIDRTFGGLQEETRRKIVHDTAARVYGLDL